MKKYFALIFALIIIISLVSCNNENDNFKSNNKITDSDDSDTSSDTLQSDELLDENESESDEYYFTAKILEKSESSMLLEVSNAGRSGLSVSTLASINIDPEYPECLVGDHIKIVFDGTILESYPCQLPNIYSVTKTVK